VQLGPLAEEMQKRGLGTFVYSQGTFEVDPPLGWEDYFGSRPLYRFLDTRQGDTFETLRRLRHVPRGMCPEDTMRMFQGASTSKEWHQQAWRAALDGVFHSIAADDEIDAIIGYSEGAMVGASVVVEEAIRCAKNGTQPRIKFAIFISGAPPLKFEGADRIVSQLADEAGVVITIPTFHIFGCDDAFLSSAIALFNVCDPKAAHMYDHGLGHIVPRDVENVTLLGKHLGEIIPKVEEQGLPRPSGMGHGSMTHYMKKRTVRRTGSETDENNEEDHEGKMRGGGSAAGGAAGNGGPGNIRGAVDFTTAMLWPVFS